jgi:hypothetical protein
LKPWIGDLATCTFSGVFLNPWITEMAFGTALGLNRRVKFDLIGAQEMQFVMAEG